MWALYKANILRKLASGEFFSDIDATAMTIANEYERALKLGGGDMLNGFAIANGNKTALVNGIRSALIKGQNAGLNDFNLLNELGPALTAYWAGATMMPFPNPLLKPLGYFQVMPPLPTIKVYGPDFIGMARSAAKIAAEKIILDKLVDELKSRTINISGVGELNVRDTIDGVLDKKITDPKIKSHPAIFTGILLINKANEPKVPTPNFTLNAGTPIKFPIPPIPRAELIQTAIDKILDDEVERLQKKQLETPPTPGIPPPPLLTPDQLKIKAFDNIKDKIYAVPSSIPNISFPPPSKFIKPSSVVWCDPFVNFAKTHLLSLSGMIMVTAQYPPPATPAPAVIMWSGYRVLDGPTIPNVPIPTLYPSNIEIPEDTTLLA